MNQQVQAEEYDEFKSSPLYAMLKAIGNLFRRKEKKAAPEDSGHIGDDDFSKFLRVDRIIRRVLRFFCWISAISLMVIMFVAFFNLIGEKLGRIGIAWAQGIPNSTAIIQYFHIPLVFLAAGYVTLDQGHTRIDLLIHKWPTAEKIFMVIGHLLGMGLSFFISYRGIFVTLAENMQYHTRINTTSDSWLVWPFTVCHCLGFFLLGLSFLWALVRLIRFWKYDGVNPSIYLYPNENKGPDAILPKDADPSENTAENAQGGIGE